MIVLHNQPGAVIYTSTNLTSILSSTTTTRTATTTTANVNPGEVMFL